MQSIAGFMIGGVALVLEGVAYNDRWLHEAVEKFVGGRLDNIRIIGGGAQSDLWCQIHADVLDREIRQVEHPIRANARGAALLASVALGHVQANDLSTKVAIAATYRPNPANRAIYDELFDEFANIYKANKPIHKRLNAHS